MTRRAALAGLLAAGPALLLLVIGHLVSDRPGLIEIISDGVSRYLPLNLFELGISTFGPLAKGLLTLGIALTLLLIGSLLAPVVLRQTAPRSPLMALLLLTVGILATIELAILPLFGAGVLGLDLASDRLALQLPLVLATLNYAGLLIGWRQSWLVEPATEIAPGQRQPTPAVGEISRRRLLGTTLTVVGAASLAGSLLSLLAQVRDAARQAAPNLDPGPANGFGPTPALTPVGDFYTVNKNLGPTLVDAASWALVIDGLVDRPEQLTLAQLSALPYQEAYRTLECISTEIVKGDHLVSNQHWRGVRVGDLLARVGVQPAASWILWQADDGYTESLPLAAAMHPDTWIAYQMGDAPLSPEHGYPARVLVPGRFGMKQPKWLRRMTLADHDASGYWEQRGWDEQAIQRTMSRIDWPTSRATVTVGVPFLAYGIAFAGDRGIARVEVSADDGASWQPAERENSVLAPLGELTWVRWRISLTVTSAGGFRLAVRATDGNGQVQSGEETAALPSGSTGWHRVESIALAATN